MSKQFAIQLAKHRLALKHGVYGRRDYGGTPMSAHTPGPWEIKRSGMGISVYHRRRTPSGNVGDDGQLYLA